MKHLKIIIRTAIAILFVFPLIAAYSISSDTIDPIIGYKIIWPLNILPKDHYTPWHDVVSGAVYTIAELLPSLLCGALFGYLFRRKTAFWAITPAAGLIIYFLMSLRNHWYPWIIYYSYGFLVFSFLCFSAIAARHYRNFLNDGASAGMKERAVLVLGIFVVLAFAGWLHFQYPLLGTRVSGEDFEGIILNKQLVEDIGRQGTSSWWEVQDGDIRALEERLRTYVTSRRDVLGPRLTNELSSYRRWYYSELSAVGNKQIHVLLMHESQVSRPQWLHVFFGVAGGGDYYCETDYTVKDGTFENIRCNADA
jgi:hypothetical protein